MRAFVDFENLDNRIQYTVYSIQYTVYESRSAVVECGFGLLDTGAMGGRGAPRQRFLPTSGKGEAWGVFLLFFFLAEHSGGRADRAAARKLQK